MSDDHQTRPALFVSHSSKDAGWAEEIHQTLSREGYRVFLDSHPDEGIHPGAEWEQLLWRRLRQSRGVVVLCSAHWLASPWCVAEAMIAHEQGKAIFLLAAADLAGGDAGTAANTIPGFMQGIQILPLAEVAPDEAEHRLLRGLEQELAEEFPAPEEPYPGLIPFDERHAAVFFGREYEIDAVMRLLRRRRLNHARGFVLVLGASGCGKSSLVRAGVVPRIRRVEHGRVWLAPAPVYGREGMEGLFRLIARAFADTGTDVDTGDLRRRLDAAGARDGGPVDHTPLQRLVGELLVAADLVDGYLLIVVDQLEEVFRTARGSDARRTLRLLFDATADPASRLVVIATMRSDSLHEFQLFEGAADRYEKVTVDPMHRSRFGRAITGPADRCGVRLEPGLAQRLVEDTGYDDALPLLAFTLHRLYQAGAEDGLLELSEYDNLFPPVEVRDERGEASVVRGVSSAIKIVADGILAETGYGGLKPDDPKIRDLRATFFRLVEIGPEGQFVRRRALTADMPESCQPVLDRFVAERLLVTGQQAGERTLAVTHEAIFRVWDTLRTWLDRSRNALLLRTQIRRAATTWDQDGRREALRWPEDRVVDAVTVLSQSGITAADPFTEVEHAFLGALDDAEILDALDDVHLSLIQRARLGRRLSLFGDERHGVGVDTEGLPDLAWVPVPSGDVGLRDMSPDEWEALAQELSRLTGGSVPDPASNMERRRLSDEDRTRSVGSIEISRYLITRAQFDAFLDADDHHDPSWWDSLPPPNRPHRPAAVPSNHPATHLSWFEAAAFCRWLGARRDADIRLPTEFEWQQAATGGDPRRLFPWGDGGGELNSRYANTFESRIRADTDLTPTTTAVGVFPRGMSPVGAFDMSGNAWEWCDSFFHGDDTRPRSAPRVVRGGSWVIGMPACTCVYSGQLAPDADTYFVGFRPIRVTAAP